MARSACVFVFFAILAVIFTAPVSLAPDRLAMDDGDPLIASWILAWNAHRLIREPWSLFDSNTFFPYEDSLAFSEHLVVPALLAAPVFYVSGNALLAHNVTVILTLALSAWAMYLLVKEILGKSDVALIAGMIYVFHAENFHEAARVQMVSVQWWPLALLYLHRLIFGDGQRKNAYLFTLFFLLQGLSCTYYLFYFSLVLAFWIPAYALTRKGGWRKLGALVLPGLLAAVVLAMFALPYMRVLQRFEFQRELGDGLDAVEYVRPPEGSLLSRAIRFDDGPTVVPHFLGYLPLLLAVVGVLWAPRDEGASSRLFFRLCIMTVLVGFVLSVGPTVRLDGRELGPGPYGFLYEHVPGFQYLRSPQRLSVLVHFGLAVIAAWGAGVIVARLSGRGALVFRVALLVLLPLEHFRLNPFVPIATGSATPDVYRWLATAPGDGAVVEVPPYPRAQLRLHSLYMFYSTYHWKPIVFGKTSFYPPLVGYLGWELRDFPSPETFALLQRVGVSRIVVRPGMWQPDERGERLARLESLRPQLVEEGRFPHLSGNLYDRYGFGDERVYRVPAYEAPSTTLCTPGDAIDPANWRIHGEGETPVQWIVDRDQRTRWRSDRQLPGIKLEVDLGREETVAAIRVAIAHPYDEFPRDLTIKVSSGEGGRFRRVFHRDDLATKLEVIDALIERPREAGLTLRFPAIRARRIRFWIREGKGFDYSLPDWSLPELYIYRSCSGNSASLDAPRAEK